MKNHIKVYYNALGHDIGIPFRDQFIPSEWSGKKAVDIHHITDRSDRIENLMALTRKEHLDMGDKTIYIVTLLMCHRLFLKENGVDFENDWFEEKIQSYNYRS